MLFDLDNTLLDFSESSKKAFRSLFKEKGLSYSEEIYGLYKNINAKVWAQFEAGQITATEIRETRFSILFKELGLTHLNGEESNRIYLDYIVQNSNTYYGVTQLLSSLKPKYKLSIVTNGLKEVQRPRLKRVGIDHFFDSIIVSDEIGVAKPHEGFFEHAYQSIQNPPRKDQMMIIGDSLKSDILGGHKFGINTCLISTKEEKEDFIIPTYQISKVTDLPFIL
ncbi:MAG: YjjG family noncanonical pyrimidine nucleotidase [Saprospiraceae bacterium]|nr:YjjG family noncanonical pyrimidine nucleotidase [Saprospiraceae bacterium]